MTTTTPTIGGVAALMRNDETVQPVLQVSKLTQVSGTRYKCTLSDGLAVAEAVLSNTVSQFVNDESLAELGLLKVDKFTVMEHNGDKKVSVVTASVVAKALGELVTAKRAAAPAAAEPAAKRPAYTSPTASKSPAPRTPGASPPKRVTMLNALNPYMNTWIVKVRVTSNAGVRSFTSRAGAPGKVMNVDLQDEQGTEMRCTLWHEMAEKHTLIVGKTYYIGRGQLKVANRQYMQVDNQYEMTLNNSSTVEEAEEEMAPMALNFNFVEFSNLGAHIGSKVPFDVVGVVKEVGEQGTVKRKSDGTDLFRRDIKLVDCSSRLVSLTAWNTLATHDTAGLPEKVAAGTVVLAVKGVRASDFNGVSLSTIGKSVLVVDPDVKETAELKKWYEAGGATAPTTDAGEGLASSRKAGGKGSGVVATMKEIQPEELAAVGAAPEWFDVRVTLDKFTDTNVRDIWYKACPEPGCNKKVVEEHGLYHCEAHNQSFPECKHRYVTQVHVNDYSGGAYVSLFNDQAEALLGQSADSLAELKGADENAFNRVLKAATFKSMAMRVKSKTDEYNGVQKRKIMVHSLQPMDYTAESNRLLGLIAAM